MRIQEGGCLTQCIFHRSATYQYRNEDGDQDEDINVRKWEKCNPRSTAVMGVPEIIGLYNVKSILTDNSI